MNKPHSIGFPRMMKEAGEKRVFLPEFVQFMANKGLLVYIEEGYGARSGFTFENYHLANSNVYMCSHSEAYQQDIVLVLRSPTIEEFQKMSPGTTLISMLHFPTRPKRVARLQELGIKAISLDGIANDQNLRLVENMKAVAWNGLEAAFDVLERRWPGLMRESGEPWKVLIFGTGMVGKHAVDAATKLGNIERNTQHIQADGPGAICWVAGRNIPRNTDRMRALFQNCDVLVDATQRRNSAAPLVPNAWLDWLPEHAVVADLAVDPYTLEINPPVVRGVEGIPQGNLNKYVFLPGDADWGETVPESVPTDCRRTVVSCYSWPGIHPEACMRHYAQQLEPLMDVLVEKGYDDLSLDGDYFERALYRASLDAWLKKSKYLVKQS